MADILSQIALDIIEAQELIIGPLAWQEAKKIEGLIIDVSTKTVIFRDDDKKRVIDLLVQQYMLLFGDASKIICKAAVQNSIQSLAVDDIPNSLK